MRGGARDGARGAAFSGTESKAREHSRRHAAEKPARQTRMILQNDVSDLRGHDPHISIWRTNKKAGQAGLSV